MKEIKNNAKIREVGKSWYVKTDKKIATYEGYEIGDEVTVVIKKDDE